MNINNKTIVITDPTYMKNSHCLMRRDTIYGDWSCMVYPGKLGETDLPAQWDDAYFEFFNKYNFSGKTPEEKEELQKEFKLFKQDWKKNILGEFCADAGEVGVFDFDELSDKDKLFIIEHPHCATVISNFTGDVTFEVIGQSVHVVGSGEKPFFSTQSGL